MQELISVIVPVYNTENYLNRCVDSILRQSYSNLEIILVDDGSSDKCPVICDQYAESDKRVKVIHKKNEGQSSARNAGIDAALGDYIGFVDSDDVISQSMYEVLLNMICGNIDTVGVAELKRFSRDEEIDTGKKDGGYAIHEIKSEDYFQEVLRQNIGMSVCKMLFPRSIVANHRFQKNRLNEDILFLSSLFLEVNCFKMTDVTGYFYYIREGSTTDGFGKAMVDAAYNSTVILKDIKKKCPWLQTAAFRYAYSQHANFFSYLSDYERRDEVEFEGEIHFVRKNFPKFLVCRELEMRKKIILFITCISPKLLFKVKENFVK